MPTVASQTYRGRETLAVAMEIETLFGIDTEYIHTSASIRTSASPTCIYSFYRHFSHIHIRGYLSASSVPNPTMRPLRIQPSDLVSLETREENGRRKKGKKEDKKRREEKKHRITVLLG